SAYLGEAERRGDRYAASSLARMFNVVWLARDDPEEALAQIDAHGWTPPAGRFHAAHFFALAARIEGDLYAGDAGATRTRHAAEIAAGERSLLMRMPTARAAVHWLLGRLAAAEGDDGAARAYASRLAREEVPSAGVAASLLRASIATAEGDDGGA